MEKYSQWTDKQTGINPFIPLKKSQSAVAKYVLGPLLVIIRVPLLLACTFVLVLLSFVFGLIPLWFIKRPLQRYVCGVLCRTILFVCGFYSIDSTILESKKGGQPIKSKLSTGQWAQLALGTDVGHGDLVLANFVSYFDILYFTFRYAPQFVWLYGYEKGDNPKLALVSPLAALWYTCFGGQPSSTPLSLSSILKQAKDKHLGPVVLFAEGVPTNGRGVLQFHPSLFESPLEPSLKVHTYGLRYKHEHVPVTFPVGSFLPHFLLVLTQIYNNMSVKRVLSSDRPDMLNTLYFEKLRAHISFMAGARNLGLSASDKVGFLEYWAQTQGKKYHASSKE